MLSRPTYSSMQSLSPSRGLTKKLMFAGVLISLAMTGCAAQTTYLDAKNLIEKDQVEEGLAKLQQAIAQDPRNTEYRLTYLQTRDRAVSRYIRQADQAADAGDPIEAEKLYRQALATDPSSDRARDGLRALDAARRQAALLQEAKAAWNKKDIDTAKLKLRSILIENPKHPEALALERAITEETAKPPAESALSIAYKKPITIEFKDVTLKQVFEVISRTSGLNFLLDKDLRTDQKTSIFLKNSTIASAVQFVLMTNQLEQQVLDGNTILIYPNTVAKQKDYQEMVVRTFFLSNAEAKTVANTLKTILKSNDVVIDEKLNLLIVRDSPDAIKLAEKLVALQDVAEPEVMLEVEILEVNRTRLQELGIRWPDSLALTPLPATTDGTLTLRDLTSLNSSRIGVGVDSLTLNARKEDTDTNILANPRIRARNHEKAKILIGERVPNITSTSTSTGFVSESINYVDVGLKLEVEPTIHLDNDVAIKVSLEVSNIVSQLQTQSGTVAYRIGTRTASTVLRLKDGENQVLAGLINDEDRRTANKVPGLGKIPIIGRLFGSTVNDDQKTEIVLSITPRLIRNIQRPNAEQSEFRAGTDSSLRSRPDSAGSSSSSTLSNIAAHSDQSPADTSAANASKSASAKSSENSTETAYDQSAANTSQLSWQGPTQLKVGNAFALQLLMQSDQPVISLPMVVGFTSQDLQVISVAEGNFLKQGGAQTKFTSRVDENGQILMTGTRSGNGGATSLGTIATITFRALAPVDASSIELVTISPIGVGGSAVSVPTPTPHVVQVQP
jgi:general secretion pathway protein D